MLKENRRRFSVRTTYFEITISVWRLLSLWQLHFLCGNCYLCGNYTFSVAMVISVAITLSLWQLLESSFQYNFGILS